jgi:uncharacterized protein (TIGR02687 family)
MLNLDSQLGEILDQFKEQPIVLWQCPAEADFESLASSLEGVSILLARDGFLNLNSQIRSLGSIKALILLDAELDDESSIAKSLRARFFEYRTTPEAQLLKQLGWPAEFEGWVSSHQAVFRNKQLLAKLKKLKIENLSVFKIGEAIVWKLFGADEKSPVGLSLSVFAGDSQKVREALESISQTSLDSVLWERIENELGYKSSRPNLDDLRVWLAQSTLSSMLKDFDVSMTTSVPSLRTEYFLQELRLREVDAYTQFCESEISSLVQLDQLSELNPEVLSTKHHVSQIDLLLFKKCLDVLSNPTLSLSSLQIQAIIKNRRTSKWFDPMRKPFEALQQGTLILELVETFDLHCSDFEAGAKNYVDSWYRVDMAYRKFVSAAKTNEDVSKEFEVFAQLVEATYVNKFQDRLGETWQNVLDTTETWIGGDSVPMARNFFKKNVRVPLSNEKNKIAVIISDAMRFEIGVEASSRLSNQGYDIKVESMISPLPSYTQLGMAALLPNTSISLKPENKTVTVDGMSSTGLENRRKILATEGGSAMDFESLVTEGNLREKVAGCRLWYIYHNQIDKVGDNAASEGSVFDAVERTFEDLKTAIQKLKAAGFNRVFITADHGFLYQDSEIPEHGFLSTVPEGDVTEFMNRRFIIGKGLHPDNGLKHFTSSQLGYDCDNEVQLPASSLRLRRRGSGLRFVHGGASLQEIVVPLLDLTKSAKKSLAQVEVVLSPGVSTKITTGIAALSFTQTEPLSDELAARELRISIFQGATRLSTSETIVFAHTDAEIRNRVTTLNLTMSNEASGLSNKSAVLKLESRIGETERWAPYQEFELELVNLGRKDF